MSADFDLLGDPIPANHGSVGRTGHVASSENVRKIRVLVASGWRLNEIAGQLGISVPTLRTHYFQNGSIKTLRQKSLRELRGRMMLMLDEQAEAGNVAAMKELIRQTDKKEMDDLADSVRHPTPPKEKTLGKKAQRTKEAAEILDATQTGDNEWGFLPQPETMKH